MRKDKVQAVTPHEINGVQDGSQETRRFQWRALSSLTLAPVQLKMLDHGPVVRPCQLSS